MEGFGFSEIILILFILLLSLCFLVFWIKMIIQCAKSQRDGSSKVVWILLMLVTGVIGSFLYYLLGSKKALDQKNS